MKFFSKSLPWQSPLKIFSDITSEENFSQILYSGTSAGKFSFIPFSPEKIFSLEYVDTYQNTSQNTSQNTFHNEKKEYTAMKKFFKNFSQKLSSVPKNWKYPFCGGLVGVFSYDAVRMFEDIPENFSLNRDLPLGKFGLYTKFFAFDHQKENFSFAGWFRDAEEFEKNFLRYSSICEKNFHIDLSSHYLEIQDQIKFLPEISFQQYKKKFFQCQAEIENGKSFQINFSQKFSAQLNTQLNTEELRNIGWEIFLQATKKNPAPMMYFCQENSSQYSQKNFSVISCSPERLFSVDRRGKIFTQPIAGTRPRGKSIDEDNFFADELKHSQKEIAEHSMIVDLLRNDMGRVSIFGSVDVSEFARIEKYKTVIHLVSDITGMKKENISVFDIFEAFFPGGTITGAPKIETMKILSALEESSRNFYCGSAGYFSFCGSADFNILIRTLEQQGKKISARAGGGLIYGATPENEYAETLHKFSGVKKIFSE